MSKEAMDNARVFRTSLLTRSDPVAFDGSDPRLEQDWDRGRIIIHAAGVRRASGGSAISSAPEAR
jgi:hypothetical protein